MLPLPNFAGKSEQCPVTFKTQREKAKYFLEMPVALPSDVLRRLDMELKSHSYETSDDRGSIVGADGDRRFGSAGEKASPPARLHPAQTTIVLIDPRYLTRECISNWLTLRGSDLQVHAHSSVPEAIDFHADPAPRDAVVLYNIGPASASDPDVADHIAQLSEAMPTVPVSLISDREDTAAIVEALDQGVRGYVPTSISASVLMGAIHLIKVGGTFIPATAVTEMDREHLRVPSAAGSSGNGSRVFEQFTPRQAQVLTCLRQGKANKTIAYELSMCESTVKVHVRHIMKKLNATNRTQVAFLTNSLFGSAATAPTEHKPR